MPQPSMRAGELACRTRSTSSSRSQMKLAASPLTCAPRLPHLTDSSAVHIAPAWMRMESHSSLETGMTPSEATPAPWEIWHEHFNFDDRGYKFRPVLVLAHTQDGLLAAMITSASNKALSHSTLPQGLASRRTHTTFPRPSGPNRSLVTDLPRHCEQDRQTISTRRTPSHSSTRRTQPITEPRPRPTKTGTRPGKEIHIYIASSRKIPELQRMPFPKILLSNKTSRIESLA